MRLLRIRMPRVWRTANVSGPRLGAVGRSARLGQSHDVALRVGDQREGYTGHVLRLLDDLAAEFSGPFHGALDIVHRDEEGDQVRSALQRGPSTGSRRARWDAASLAPLP